MVHYRRNRVPGGIYFFTVTLIDRRSILLVEHIDLLRQAYRETAHQRPFSTVAITVLPDHLHAIWKLPEADCDYSSRWRAIKSRVTRLLKTRGVELTRDERGEHRLWQRRYWEHTLRDEGDLQRHVDYIHYNPVKHGLAERAVDWKWSSIHHYVRLGFLPRDWGASMGGPAEPGSSASDLDSATLHPGYATVIRRTSIGFIGRHKPELS